MDPKPVGGGETRERATSVGAGKKNGKQKLREETVERSVRGRSSLDPEPRS